MDVEVESRGDVGVPEEYAHGLVVAVAFYASGGERVAQAVVFEAWDVELCHELVVVVAVGARLRITLHTRILCLLFQSTAFL